MQLFNLKKQKVKGLRTEENFNNIAKSYSSLGEDEKAAKTYEEVFNKLYPSKSMYEKMGWFYYKNNDGRTRESKSLKKD